VVSALDAECVHPRGRRSEASGAPIRELAECRRHLLLLEWLTHRGSATADEQLELGSTFLLDGHSTWACGIPNAHLTTDKT
jgi:hypothetical protein